MPHNRTRTWVGLAIAAVTIPAVAQYYYGSAPRPATASPSLVERQASEVRTPAPGRLAIRQTDRDYLGEVNSALAKAGSHVPSGDAEPVNVPLIYEAPVQAIMGEVRPIDQPASDDDVPSVSSTPTGRVASTYDPQDDTMDDQPSDTSQMSDRTVYQLVLDNLSDDDRETFVSAWAVMTPEERASLLDEWRANLQNRP
jgi:hypothetical protein